MSRILALLLLIATSLAGAAERSVVVDDGTEVTVEVFGENGGPLLLWLPSEAGILEQDRAVARDLAGLGVQVWIADLLGAWFLPAVESSIERVPAGAVAALIEAADADPGRVFLLGPGRGALLALRGARRWQLDHPGRALGGVLLLSPKLFVTTPEPGQEGRLMPVVSRTNLAVAILQPELSPWRWKLDRIVAALEAGGSDCLLWQLPGVRDRFYYRPDATAAEQALAAELATYLHRALGLLEPWAGRVRAVAAGEVASPPPPPEGRPERRLRPFRGDPRPPALVLDVLDDGRIDLRDLRGQVVLVNFWASWCPPCVHEMPSMQALADHFAAAPFRILAVNMAEDEATIRRFLRERIRVRLPILLDRDGSALRRWRVYAFPTSFVLDRRGRIRYAVFGAIDWMAPRVTATIADLLAEDAPGGGP